MELCRQASVEQDREKLFRLVCRINELLEAKDKRSRSGRCGAARSCLNVIAAGYG